MESNCNCQEFYPKKLPSYWSDEKGIPNSNFNYTFSIIAILVVAITIVIPVTYTVITTQQASLEIPALKETLGALSCDELQAGIANESFSEIEPASLLSERYFAKQEYKYKCLDIERPSKEPLSTPFADNPRGK